jgi:hypothetical protein
MSTSSIFKNTIQSNVTMPKTHKNTPADRGRLAGKQKRYMHDRQKLYPQDLDLADRDPEYVEAYQQAYHKQAPADKPPKVLKVSTSMYCCPELLDRARKLGINRSKVFEAALKLEIGNKTTNYISTL